jgi:hypothetical protein
LRRKAVHEHVHVNVNVDVYVNVDVHVLVDGFLPRWWIEVRLFNPAPPLAR